jgi:hypothetical protein
MEVLVKPEILTSYIHGPTFGNAECLLFLFPSQCFNTESMQKVSLGTVVCNLHTTVRQENFTQCKHFAGYQGYPNYRWELIR